MNDYEYEFRSDVREKKTTAMSAKHRVCGANSTKVSLSQDTLSNKELAERNGPMETYNLSKPMTWKQFRLMPRDLQKEYLDKLRAKYNATGNAIAGMFGLEKTTVNLYFKDTILSDPLKHRRMSEEQILAWDNFVNHPKNDEVKSPDDVVEPEEEQEAAAREEEEATEEDIKIFRAHDLEEPPRSEDAVAECCERIDLPTFRTVSAILSGTPSALLTGLNALLQALPYDQEFTLRLVTDAVEN